MLRNRVREFREIYGLSRLQLAAASGVSYSVINDIEETPGYLPSASSMIKLCNHFNCDLGRIFWIDRTAQKVAV